MARGDRIGDYQIEHELATGTLYRGIHSVLPRRALIRIAADPSESVAVLREACILAALPHPGIVRVYETGRFADGRTWFAREVVEGLTLAGTFVMGAIEPAVATSMIRDVAEVLAYAHQRGVIHGGITPEKLVVAGRNRGFPMCITDWSHARTHDTEQNAPVERGVYTAPEIVMNGVIDDRIDVFALGVVAYRALTGELPFEDDTVVPTGERAPAMPRELTTLVDQMLAYERWDRPSAAEVRTELGRAAMALATFTPGLTTHEPMRIRKPRWTPQVVHTPLPDLDLDPTSSDHDDVE